MPQLTPDDHAKRRLYAALTVALLTTNYFAQHERNQTTPHDSKSNALPNAKTTVDLVIENATNTVELTTSHKPLAPHPSLRHIKPILDAITGTSISIIDYDDDD